MSDFKILIVKESDTREIGLVYPGELQVVGYQEHVRLIGELRQHVERLLELLLRMHQSGVVDYDGIEAALKSATPGIDP